MPSKFGGVPVGGSRFGGEPVEDPGKLDAASAEQMVADIERKEGKAFEPQARAAFIADLQKHGSEILVPDQAPNPANSSDFAGLVTGRKDQVPTQDAESAAINAGTYGPPDMINAGRAFLHNLGSLGNGIGQLGGHVLGGFAEMLPEGNPVRDWFAQHVREGDERLRQGEAQYQANVPDSAASYAGAAAGQVLPWMVGGGELRAAGYLPKVVPLAKGAILKGLAQRGGALAVEGGVMGLTQPVIGEGPYAAQKGRQVAVGAAAAPVIGGVTGAAVKGGQAVAALSRYLTPAGRDAIADARLARMIAPTPENIAALRQPSGVPGFDPTPAQALATPEAVQAERVLRNNGLTAPAFAERESANNLAARNQVAAVARPPASTDSDPALEAVKAARTRATQPFRDRFLPEEGSVAVDPTGVVATLRKLTLSGNDTVRQAAKKHLGLIEEHMAQNGGKIPATALDDIRQGVGTTLRSIPNNGVVTPKEVALYGHVSSSITDALDRAVPGYRNYLAAYARHSQPINDIEAGRALLAAIDNGGRDAGGNQAVSLNAVKAMLSKDNRAEFPMSDSARKQIEAVLDALQRRSVTNNSVAASGSNTAADVQRAVQASPLLTRILNHGAGVAGGVTLGPLGYLAGAGTTEGVNALNNSVVRRLGQKASSAPRAADALEAYLRKTQPKQDSAVWRYVLPYEPRALPKP